MTQEQVLGFALMLIGAVCGGSFGLPSKFVKEGTPWEVLWGPFFFFVTIVMPVIVAPLVVKDLGGIYAGVGTLTILTVLAFGFLWGLGSMTLGMSFAFIGLSLAYALNYGAQIACGFTLPMLLFDADQFLTGHGYVILAGVLVCLIGVVVSGLAGILKERSLRKDEAPAKPMKEETAPSKQPKMLLGLLLAFASGILCACYAVAYRCAQPISDAATGAGNEPWAAAWAVTAMILWGGAVSSCIYCAVLLTRNGTWKHLAGPGVGRVLGLAAVMAVLHNAAIFFFGLGAINLGGLGVSAGYPVFMSFAIIVGNVHGFRTGEWKGASVQSVLWIIVGIAILIAGVCIIARGKAMMQEQEPDHSRTRNCKTRSVAGTCSATQPSVAGPRREQTRWTKSRAGEDLLARDVARESARRIATRAMREWVCVAGDYRGRLISIRCRSRPICEPQCRRATLLAAAATAWSFPACRNYELPLHGAIS